MTLLLAHRDKRSGTRVLCGCCGNEIARILERSHNPGRYVYFPIGWYPRSSDGAWTLTRHASDRTRRGFEQNFRKPTMPSAKLARTPTNQNDPNSDWRRKGRVTGILPEGLPVTAACLTCAHVVWLTAEKLGVDPFHRPTTSLWKVTESGSELIDDGFWDLAPGTIFVDR
jgi:hypothetical protein